MVNNLRLTLKMIIFGIVFLDMNMDVDISYKCCTIFFRNLKFTSFLNAHNFQLNGDTM